MRFGPKPIRWTSAAFEPGPPFQANVIGRGLSPLARSRVYDTKNIWPCTSPDSLSRIGMRPARAVYRSVRPPTVVVWRVATMGSSCACAGRAAPASASTIRLAILAGNEVVVVRIIGFLRTTAVSDVSCLAADLIDHRL